ncbi:SdpI family protein [Spirochaeta cellobiosiphila]|uniref:SdpI family protein n=1 Tax=Spirochaeta cellobiosiphila TaxID=504483 RepID=UPI000411A064|nr:SdpI family protein [Spirochaeta cellobiosiphila]
MKFNKWVIVITVLTLGVIAWFYKQLPEQIPTHFNIKGEVDDWGPRNVIWLFGFLPVVIYMLLFFIPRIDPRKENYKKHIKSYSFLAFTVFLFLIVLGQFMLFYSLGYDLNIKTFLGISIGILFILTGNYLPRARQNYTYGIRTPWTLANEVSWTKTHRVGGFGFVVSGFFLFIAGFFTNSRAFVISTLFIPVLIIGLFVYSYIIYKLDTK